MKFYYFILKNLLFYLKKMYKQREHEKTSFKGTYSFFHNLLSPLAFMFTAIQFS